MKKSWHKKIISLLIALVIFQCAPFTAIAATLIENATTKIPGAKYYTTDGGFPLTAEEASARTRSGESVEVRGTDGSVSTAQLTGLGTNQTINVEGTSAAGQRTFSAYAVNPDSSETAALAEEDAKTAAMAQTNSAGTSGSSTKKPDLDGGSICSFGFFSFNGLNISRCIGWSLYALGTWIVGVAGQFMNFAIDVSVLRMSSLVSSVGAVAGAWQTFRDLANVFFIFILIYIAIMTILGLADGHTFRQLRNLVLVAIFINFSLFFTKVIIDTSNIVTIQFYNSISKGNDPKDNGLAYVLMNSSGMSTFFAAPQSEKVFKDTNYMLVGFLSLMFGFILAFALVAIALLFLIRLGILMMLMIFSPLAFLGHAHPKLHGLWDQFWKQLIDQAIFAPFMMAVLWVVVAIMNNPAFVQNLGRNDSTEAFVNLVGAGESGTGGTSALIIVNFAILIILLIFGMTQAKRFGGAGSSAIIGAFDKYSRATVGRMTFGGAAAGGRFFGGGAGVGLLKSERFQKFAARNPTLGGIAYKGAEKLAKSSYDVRATALGKEMNLGQSAGEGGRLGTLEKQIKERQRIAGELEGAHIYSDKQTEKLAHELEDTKKKSDAQIKEINDKTAALRAGGLRTQEEKAQMAELENQRVAVINNRNEAARKLKELQDDQSRTKTGEQAYGENLKVGPIAAVMKRLSREREDAAKKIGADYEKDRVKQETKFAEDATLNKLDDLINILKRQKTETTNAEQEIIAFQRRIAENTGRVAKINEDIQLGKGNVITNNREKDSLAAENARNEREITRLRTEGVVDRNERDARIEREINAVNLQKNRIKGKRTQEKFREAVQELNSEEGGSGAAGETPAGSSQQGSSSSGSGSPSGSGTGGGTPPPAH